MHLCVSMYLKYRHDLLNICQFIFRSWFYIGVALIGITFAIGFFLIVYLSWIKKVSTDDWELQYPAAIPVATGSFAFGSFWLVFVTCYSNPICKQCA